MIVEDDPMVAEFNKRYLNQVDGYELAAVCSSVDQALNVLENQRIGLVLLDIFMPGKMDSIYSHKFEKVKKR